MIRENLPSTPRSLLVVLALTAAWGGLRLWVFRESLLPLTYVLPLLVCVWTRRAWQLWGMAAVFALMAAAKNFWLLPPGVLSDVEDWTFFLTTLLNILAGATVVQVIIVLRARLDERNARLVEQNAELEAQAEELAQQNEEIKAQAEELAQQNEEIESQAEELTGQNEELHAANERLAQREEILQGLLESTRRPETGFAALRDVCRRALHALGAPAECIAILRLDPDRLRVKVQASDGGGLSVPEEWPLAGTIAQVVLAENKTAYLSDLAKEPALASPFGASAGVGSLLATPLRVAGEHYGVVVAVSARPAHWSQEQFRILEWVAAQSGLIAEGIRWQKAAVARTREIEAANRAKDQFLAMLSHELRTPLTPVLAAAGVLAQDERLPAEVREDLRMIGRNVAIQSRLVDDLLDLTRLGRGKLELDTQPLELAGLLRETAAIVAPDLDARDQTLALDLAGVNGAQVLGDGPRLQQVFWNLLKNAVKFSPRQARIAVVARPAERGDRVVVEVTDEGIGVDPADLERIFQPFEQAAADGKQRGNDAGLGLGLAIAKALVELHQGTISVRSAGLGQGATFAVDLPLTTPREASPTKSGASRAPLAGAEAKAPWRILLVEDHGDTGRVLARLLRNAGYVVEHAEHARGALERFREQSFDVVISDLGLPDESGLVLMGRLRELDPTLPGICLSGYGMEDDLEACRAAGFAEHLTKPVDMQRLHAAIARVRAAPRAARGADAPRSNLQAPEKP